MLFLIIFYLNYVGSHFRHFLQYFFAIEGSSVIPLELLASKCSLQVLLLVLLFESKRLDALNTTTVFPLDLVVADHVI